MNIITSKNEIPELRTARGILFACFFLSGMTGLMYEVVWVRLFTLVFGNTVFSTAAVLAAFMGGLGVGGWWAGRFIEKRTNPALWYGVVELLIGAYALVPPVLIHALEGMYPALYRAAGGSAPALLMLKLALAAAIIAPPAFCMGATLPLMTKFFSSLGGRFSAALSLLYGLNTLGAVTGTFLTGFVFLSTLGIQSTLQMAMALNIGIGLLAVVQNSKLKAIEEDVAGGEEAEDAPSEVRHVHGFVASLAVPCTFAAGFVSMLMEVAWTRTLALVLGSSVYAFILILAAFLLGISLGSIAFGRLTRRGANGGALLLGVCFLGVAFFSSAAFPCLERVVYLFGKTISIIKGDYNAVLGLEFAASILIMLPPALFFGAAFPAAVSLYTGGVEGKSGGLGKIYFWNTFGAILGSSLTGFLFIPAFGVHGVLSAGAVGAAAAGVALVVISGVSSPKRLAGAAAVSAAVLLCVFTWKWEPQVMGSGPFIYYYTAGGSRSFADFRNKMTTGAKLLFYKDGPACSVSVHKTGSMLFLRVNGKTDASTAGDVPTQVYLGSMPLLLHPSPGDVAVIGMGSGMTSGTALQFGNVRNLDIIEIEPAVRQANVFFKNYNFNALKDKRTRVHIEDGRNYMLAHERKFDVIISEPSNHWIAGVASLYSKDYFDIAATRLKPGGIYCQWLQFYSMSPASLSMILNTFQGTFPETHLFLVRGDLFLIGSKTKVEVDSRKIKDRFQREKLGEKLAKLKTYFTPLGISTAHYVAGPDEVRRLSALGGVNSDDHPYLEFAAPFEMFADATPIYNMVQNAYPVDPLERTGLDPASMTPEDYLEISRDMSAGRRDAAALQGYLEKAAAGKGKTSADAHAMLADMFAGRNLSLAADDEYRAAIAAGAGDDVKFKYATFLNRNGHYSKAAETLTGMGKGAASNPRYYEAMAAAAAGEGIYAAQYANLMKLASMLPGKPAQQAAIYRDAAKALQKAAPENKRTIAALLAEANKAMPYNPQIARDYAEVLYREGKPQEALAVLAKPFSKDPNVVEVNLLILEIKRSLENSQRGTR